MKKQKVNVKTIFATIFIEEEDKKREQISEKVDQVLDEFPKAVMVKATQEQIMALKDAGFKLHEAPRREFDIRRDRPGVWKELPPCFPSTPLSEIEAAYLGYLAGEPLVSEVVNLDGLAASVRDNLWHHLRNLEDCGHTNVPTPAAHPDSSVVTTDELNNIWAAKMAHVLWLDHNRLVPWRLSGYARRDLEMLLCRDYFFERRTVDGAVRDVMTFLIDHSPSEAYFIAQEFLAGTPRETVLAIVNAGRFPRFIHGVRGRHPIDQIDTLDEMWERGVSLHGCHSAVKLLVGLASSLNIAGYYDTGWYVGTGHGTAIWPDAGFVLLHGDNIYDAYLRATPTDHLLCPYNHFHYAIEPHGKYSEGASYWTMRRIIWLQALFPSSLLINDYCHFDPERWSSGREFLGDHFGGFLPPSAVEDIEERIRMLVGGCR
jgi:hypothetical protein